VGFWKNMLDFWGIVCGFIIFGLILMYISNWLYSLVGRAGLVIIIISILLIGTSIFYALSVDEL
jgi:hypothetical protein